MWNHQWPHPRPPALRTRQRRRCREEQTCRQTVRCWIASYNNELFVEAGPKCDTIFAKAPHNAIVQGCELRWSSLEIHPALFEQADAITGGERLGYIVCHYNSGEVKFLPVVDDHFENGVACRRVEASRRFVEKHQCGTRDQ